MRRPRRRSRRSPWHRPPTTPRRRPRRWTGRTRSSTKAKEHDFDGPLSKTQEAQREEAIEQVISGEASVKDRDGSKVVQLKSRKGDSKYVELGREKTDKIFTILVEFGDQVDSRYGGTAYPLHNQIAAPDRSKDNSTAWQADYNQKHFQELYFGTGKNTESLKKYYEKQSSGRYSVEGEVTDWVKVPYNEARYGSNNASTGAWYAVQDGVNAWVAEREAAERHRRRDQGGAGRVRPVGPLRLRRRRRLQRVGRLHRPLPDRAHAARTSPRAAAPRARTPSGRTAGTPSAPTASSTGPDTNKLGGAQVGDTGIWVGDYTIQPENGGLGVYAHEYGHDLGLPDEYDTSGGGENSTGFWTLMSSGSWLGTGKEAIGDLPGDMNAWDKLQLGWLDYDVAKAGVKSTHTLGVAEYNTKNAQALVVQLPEKEVTTEVVAPAEGATQWWSGSGDDLRNTLTRAVDLTGKASASLSLDGWWDIEQDYDYLYTEVSTDGANWTPVDGTLADGSAIPRDGSGKPALTGTVDAYQKLTFPLNAYAGQKISLRFRYATDGGVAQKGFAADEIKVTADGATLFSDNAETADAAWTATGFSRIGASITDDYAQYYIAENRQYVSYDKTLKVGPYNFGFSTTRPDWVEHYAYQNGLLIWKWDTSQADDNTSQHPGEGLILPVDSHPTALKWADGSAMNARLQSFDSPFSQYRTDAITLHRADVAVKIKSRPGVPVFDDGKSTYYDATTPLAGVRVTDTNTSIKIVNEPLSGSTIKVKVGPSTK